MKSKLIYRINVTKPFTDKNTEQTIKAGEVFTTDDWARLVDIVDNKRLGTFAGCVHTPARKDNRIMIHQKYCYKIGGIETANYNIATTFKNRNLVFVFESGDTSQILRLAKYHDVIIDDGKSIYDVDVAIFTNYDSAPSIISRVNARKIYQQIHADFYALKQMKEWRNFVWKPNPKVDAVLSVSETAQNGLQRAFGVESTILPNLLPKLDTERSIVFLALTRATPEKGVDRLVKFFKKLDDAGKDYVLILCSTVEQANNAEQIYLRDNPRVITLKPTPYTKALLRSADYLIQLSYNESYCYSVREALQMKVPCIVSDVPELRKLIKDGKNGFIYDDNFDIERLWKTSLKLDTYEEDVSPLWEDVLDGKI